MQTRSKNMRSEGLVPLLACVIALGVSCVPPEPVVDLSREYTEDTVMGEIQAAGHITIGIPDDAYPLGYADQNGAAQGFAAELGTKIAETLDVEARFITGSSEQLLELPERELADVTFPAVAITESRVRKYQFSDPYYISHQQLLVPSGGGIGSVHDLAGSSVCAIGTHGEGVVSLSELEPTIEVTEAEPQQCLHFLRRGEVEAVTGPDYLLGGLALAGQGDFEVIGDQLTTEGIGAVVERGAAGWTDFVNGVFYLAEQEGLWADAYVTHLEPALAVVKDPPSLTAEEAAALYPNEI